MIDTKNRTSARSPERRLPARAWIGMVVALWVVGALLLLWVVLCGNEYDTLLIIVVLSPVLVTVYCRFSSLWVAIIAGMAPLAVRMSIPFLGAAATTTLLLPLATLGLLVIEHWRSRRTWTLRLDAPSRCILVLAIMMSIRMLIDRPGSAQMGAKTGGISDALFAVVGVWSFFLAEPLLRRMGRVKTSLIVLAGLGAMAAVHFAFKTGFLYSGALFHRQMWVVAAVCLAWWFHRDAMRKRTVSLGTLCLLLAIFACAAAAPHRSRPLFAVAMIGAGLFAYRRVSVLLHIFLPVLAVGLIAIVTLKPELLPRSTLRSMSTVLKVESIHTQGFAETGWKSGVRAELYGHAWRKIKKKPLFGHGFGFDTMEVIMGVNMAGHTDQMQSLDAQDSYHNSLLMLAARCGLLAPILYLAAMLMILPKYALWCRRLPVGETKLFAVTWLIYVFPICGQMLMNGGMKEFSVVTFVLGLQHIMMKQSDACPSAGEVCHDVALAERA